jgi:hypothetical protein
MSDLHELNSNLTYRKEMLVRESGEKVWQRANLRKREVPRIKAFGCLNNDAFWIIG